MAHDFVALGIYRGSQVASVKMGNGMPYVVLNPPAAPPDSIPDQHVLKFIFGDIPAEVFGFYIMMNRLPATRASFLFL